MWKSLGLRHRSVNFDNLQIQSFLKSSVWRVRPHLSRGLALLPRVTPASQEVHLSSKNRIFEFEIEDFKVINYKNVARIIDEN